MGLVLPKYNITFRSNRRDVFMNLEKFTDRAKGFLQSAQTVAIRMNHQRIAPDHILKALLEDEQGMASGLIAAAGGDAKRALSETDLALAKIPAVSGSGAQTTPGIDNDAVRVLDQAEQIAQKAGDSFVTVERLLVALALSLNTPAGRALKAAGATPEALNTAINGLRRGAFRGQRGRGGPLRRAEEIRTRPDPGGARRQAGSRHRPRRGDSPHDPDPGAPDQEQSRADRRTRRRQDRDRGGASRCASRTATCPIRSRTAG